MNDPRADVTISHQTLGDGGKYVAHPADSETTGYLEWEQRGTTESDTGGKDVRIATHTLVPPAIGNRGIAARLVERMVADAREQGFRIDPQCSYVEALFKRHPDWADLRA